MFRRNQAPNEVLAALSAHQTSRNCGVFWSILCFIPTCGTTGGCCDNDRSCCCYKGDRDPNRWGCCFPKPVDLASDATLEALIDALKKIKISKQDFADKTQVGCQFDEKQFIEWQVKETLAVLGRALNGGKIQGTYREALERVNTSLRTKAEEAESFGKILATETSPLTGTQPYSPIYGFNV